MHKILISIPDNLACRLRAAIPPRSRSKVISHLIAVEIDRREHDLYDCALSVEKDEALNEEMKEWDITVGDGLKGLEDESR
jgi:hypothetical protein